LCSTPYGINGFGTLEPNGDKPKPFLCSTPYGINGFGTPPGAGSQHLQSRAQRLTASMVSARIAKTTYPAMAVCSTPYGINGFGTDRQPSTRLPFSVLNALRHQWFRHPNDRLAHPHQQLSAQRLTASMVSAPPQLWRELTVTM